MTVIALRSASLRTIEGIARVNTRAIPARLHPAVEAAEERARADGFLDSEGFFTQSDEEFKSDALGNGGAWVLFELAA